ncbi:MAG: hypothetical protein ABIR96_07455 [Bdellovibrionota bacterium]
MTLDRNQKKFFGFVVITLLLIVTFVIHSCRSVEPLESVLTKDRQKIDAALADQAHTNLSTDEMVSLMRLGQAEDPVLVPATEKWGKVRYPEVSETFARGLAPQLGKDPKALPLMSSLFEAAAPRTRLVILRSIDDRGDQLHSELLRKLAASWKPEAVPSLEFLAAQDLALLHDAGKPNAEKVFGKRFDAEFKKWLTSTEAGLDLETVRRVVSRASERKFALNSGEKKLLNKKLELLAYDEKLQKQSFENLQSLVRSF